MKSVLISFAEVKPPRVLWGMSAPDAWDAAEQTEQLDAGDGWERSFASDGDGVISFSELPPLPPMQDLQRAAVLLQGVPGEGAGDCRLCSAAEGVTLLKRFSPSDVLGNGFWPSIREGLMLSMHASSCCPLGTACATLLSDMYHTSAASTPGTAAEILAGWLQHRMCSQGSIRQHDELLIAMLSNLEDVWKNAVGSVQDTLFVSLCQQPSLWSTQVWHSLLHGTWPRGCMPQWLLLTGALARSFACLLGSSDGSVSPPQAAALLLQAAASGSLQDAVAGTAVRMHTQRSTQHSAPLQLWPSQGHCSSHASLAPSLEAARDSVTSAAAVRTQVPSRDSPALQTAMQAEMDPWCVSGDPLQGLWLVPEGVLLEDQAVNGLVRSTDPAWCRGVIRDGQAQQAVSSALKAMLVAAPTAHAADVLIDLTALLCPEGGTQRELSCTAASLANCTTPGVVSGECSPSVHSVGMLYASAERDAHK